MDRKSMHTLLKYFPGLTREQQTRFADLSPLYTQWNARINVVSRKDIDQLYTRHVLHSLSIAKVIRFSPASSILDVGTGGGFPGIPLAILFPRVQFHLVDSIGKKVRVVEEVTNALGLQNVSVEQQRAENLTGSYDFIVSRAVTTLPQFVRWVQPRISKNQKNELDNGILYIKGGDFKEELKSVYMKSEVFPINRYFKEDFFKTKAVVYLH